MRPKVEALLPVASAGLCRMRLPFSRGLLILLLVWANIPLVTSDANLSIGNSP
jgi:hypothetical protein